jgi:WD40 repeat protein
MLALMVVILLSSEEEHKCHALESIALPLRGEVKHFKSALEEAYAIQSQSQSQERLGCGVRALLCPNGHLRGLAKGLLTGGDDRKVRYWDLQHPEKSFTVSGDVPGETRSFYEAQRPGPGWWKTRESGQTTLSEVAGLEPPKLYVCQDSVSSPLVGAGSVDLLSSAAVGAVERKGAVAPCPAHRDSVLDLKLLDLHRPLVVSAGREGIIKLWR